MLFCGDLNRELNIEGRKIKVGQHAVSRTLDLLASGEYQSFWKTPDVFSFYMIKEILDFKKAPTTKAADRLIDKAIPMSLPCPWTDWYGIDVSHIENYARLYTLVALNARVEEMSQETFNFLSCKGDGFEIGLSDLSHQIREIEVHRADKFLATQFKISQNQERFIEGFVSNLIEEAEPFRETVFTGAFVLSKTPFEFLDEMIEYSSIRVFVSPEGIKASIVNEQEKLWCPVFWSPEFDTCLLLGSKLGSAINIVLASIWRDASVVKEKWATRKSKKRYKKQKKGKGKSEKTILPRIVYHVEWSSDSERKYITREAHTVRPFYRRQPSGWRVNKDIDKVAKEFGFPPPPKGFTFVRPHTRGGKGKADKNTHREIVCRGLQTATVALSAIKGVK